MWRPSDSPLCSQHPWSAARREDGTEAHLDRRAIRDTALSEWSSIGSASLPTLPTSYPDMTFQHALPCVG
jgi:hypothetical protein